MPSYSASSVIEESPRSRAISRPTHPIINRQRSNSRRIPARFLDSSAQIYTDDERSYASKPAVVPAKAMKVLGYYDSDTTPSKVASSKKPILHRIQTSFSKPEDNFKSSPVKQIVKPKPSKMTSADKMDSLPYPTRSTHSNTPASSQTLNKNFRPIPYAAVVQINMFLDGGSEEDWLARSRRAGPDGLGGGVEIGGYKDENGLVWWDADEKMEWSSLLPKEDGGNGGQTAAYDPWVAFNEDRLNSASSTDSSGSWVSMDKPILEVESAMAQMSIDMGGSIRGSRLPPVVSKPGAYLFPVDTENLGAQDHRAPTFSTRTSPVQKHKEALHLASNLSRSTASLSPSRPVSGLHRTQSLGSIVGFEDHFVRSGSDGTTTDNDLPKERLQTIKGSRKRGVGPSLRAMWGK